MLTPDIHSSKESCLIKTILKHFLRCQIKDDKSMEQSLAFVETLSGLLFRLFSAHQLSFID